VEKLPSKPGTIACGRRYVVRYDLAKVPKYKPEKNFSERKAERIANRGKAKMAHACGEGSMAESEAKWARMREEQDVFLKEIGQKYPPCGFSVGDGWLEPVKDALRKITKIAQEAGLEWQLAQVKQKFCQLRIYIDVETPGDVTRENHDSEKNPWLFEENHPLHAKYREIQAAVHEAEIACDTRCESCGAQTKGGAASGWKGCAACKAAEKKAYEEKYGEKWED
jgi:hypothetical protein